MLHCFSVDHQNAPLHARECLAMTETQQRSWLATHQQAAIISTCNRFELITYATPDVARTMWEELVGDHAGPYTRCYTGQAAARHLFAVASGLESAILGEAEILGQVTTAYQRALDEGSAGGSISAVLKAAIHTAKRVRTETALSRGAVSFISVGIQQAEAALGYSIMDKPILVVGAGEMGASVLKALTHRGATDVTLLSRTFSRAQAVAESWGVNVVPAEKLRDYMGQSVMIVSASSAPHTIIKRADVEQRSVGEQVLIDLALPRDIDPTVTSLPGIYLFDLENLKDRAEAALTERRAILPVVDALIDEELRNFWLDFETRRVVPTIRQMRDQVEDIRQSELERVRARIANSDDPLAVLEEFSYRFMNKVLHQPTIALRQSAPQDDNFHNVTRDLFGLD
jgi:glutamyl-tRNA reductase